MSEAKSDSTVLLACPFCGSPAEIVRVWHEYWPKCTGINKACLLSREPRRGEDGFTYESDAILVWNRRAK